MNKITSVLEDIVKDKKKLLMSVLLIFGVVVLLFFGGGDSKSNTEASGTLEEYKQELESELSELCESIEGAGKCRVSVSFSEGESIEYHGSDIKGSTPPKVAGVTVISEGGSNAGVRSAISDAMIALFGIGSNRVCVLPMK